MSKTVCIYHANCTDGFGAAWALRQALGNDVEFIPTNYQEDAPDVTDKNVYIVDFSYKQDVMRELAQQANTVIVIDHHKTAQAELTPLFEEGVITGIFDMEKSGAMLTWEWFHNYPAPTLIKHIQDRDLWQWELKGTREIQSALFSYPFDFELWDKFMQPAYLPKLRQEGAAIARAFNKNLQDLLDHSVFLQHFAGYDVPVLNAPGMFASEGGNRMCKDHPFAVVYQDDADGRKYVLRSTDEGEDVSRIAAYFGGGGHRNAAGFFLPYDEICRLDDIDLSEILT